jgi:hypothetical protein
MRLKYKVVCENNTQCKDENLRRSTEYIIPMLENFIKKIDFEEYTSDEFSLFLEDFQETNPFEFRIVTTEYFGRNGKVKVPGGEAWIIVHEKNHHCRIELMLKALFRSIKIDKILYK